MREAHRHTAKHSIGVGIEMDPGENLFDEHAVFGSLVLRINEEHSLIDQP